MASIKDDNGHNQGFELVPSTQLRMKRRADFFAEVMDKTKPIHVLEIGCGTGEISFWIAEKYPQVQMLGTDICVPFIKGASEKYKLPNLQYSVLDFNNPAVLEGQKFDYIIGNGILHHLYYFLDGALQNLKNLLKENGRIIFMEPNIYNPYCAAIFNIKYLRGKANLEEDEMAFSKTFIINKLITTGYRNIKVTYKDFLIPGVPMILVKPIVFAGNILEKIPLINMITQSLFIEAQN